MISPRLRQRDSLLFVYGTLRPFSVVPMALHLRERARYVGPALARGRLFDLGDYPGMTRARCNREWVVGDVYRIVRRSLLATLDRYERHFVRRRCTVWLTKSRRHEVWFYEYGGLLTRRARIEHGDYRLHLEET